MAFAPPMHTSEQHGNMIKGLDFSEEYTDHLVDDGHCLEPEVNTASLRSGNESVNSPV